jgi:hypothetical protein
MKSLIGAVGLVFACFMLHSAEALLTSPPCLADVGTHYSVQVLKPCPNINYCLQAREPGEGTNYIIQTIHK